MNQVAERNRKNDSLEVSKVEKELLKLQKAFYAESRNGNTTLILNWKKDELDFRDYNDNNFFPSTMADEIAKILNENGYKTDFYSFGAEIRLIISW